MGMIEAVIFGLFSLTALTFAVICLADKKHAAAVILSFISLLMTVLSAYNWRLALIDSGKNPALLGFYRYPLVPVILLLLCVGSILCLILSIVFIIKHKKK